MYGEKRVVVQKNNKTWKERLWCVFLLKHERCFFPDGYEKTMGNYPDEERCLVWNTDAYHELAEFLKNKED